MDNRTTRRNVMLGAGAATVTAGFGFMRPAFAAADPANLITWLATIDVAEGKLEEAIAFNTAMAKAVEAAEPGTLAFLFYTMKDQPSQVLVYEIYDGPEGHKAHDAVKRAEEAGLELDTGWFKGMTAVELERVCGYVR